MAPVNVVFIAKQLWDLGRGGQMRSLFRSLWIRAREQLEHRRVAPGRAAVSAEEWAARVRQLASERELCDELGVARMHAGLYFEGGEPPPSRRPARIIVLLQRMQRAPMEATLQEQAWRSTPRSRRKWVTSAREVMKVYADVQAGAAELARWIRSEGFAARAYGGAPGSDINMLRAALEAGLGELGKHGSIINAKHGSIVRFAVVLTDMPLPVDAPADFGADDFCARCRLCERACPPNAISSDKLLVRGAEKWYVNFDACVAYFNDTSGCGVCIAVCPWSRPGVAETLHEKLARRRSRG